MSLESRRTLGKSNATTDKYYSPKDEDKGKYLKVRSTNSRGFYCLTCIEDLFSGVGMLDDDYTTPQSTQQASLTPDSPASAPVSVDGSSDEIFGLRTVILEAAEKLYPTVRIVKEARVRTQAKLAAEVTTAGNFNGFGSRLATDVTKIPSPTPLAATPAYGDLEGQPTAFPSNLDEAILLRDAKCQETKATLRHFHQVTHRQYARQLSQSSSNEELPSLKILRPKDISPWKERYKKQGLTERYWRMHRSSLPAIRLRDDNTASIMVSMEGEDGLQPVAPVERFCYCREPDDLRGMVQCSAEFCLIGRVHLKCSGLPRLPIENETWFCNQCSALFGPGTFNPALATTLEHGVRRTRVLRSTVRAASEFVDRNESGNVASDELSTDETSLSVSDDESVDPTYTLPVTPRRQSNSVVTMTYTPCEFLDGVGEGKAEVRSPACIDQTATHSSTSPAIAPPTNDEHKSAKSSLIRAKRAPTLTRQDPNEPITPTKRLKTTSSPPPPLTPPSRHIKTSFGHLAPFVYAETRTSAAALSNAHIVALEMWKSVHLHSPLTELIQSSTRDAVRAAATTCSPSNKSQQAFATNTNAAAPNIATLELGGTVIDLPAIHSKKLSQILAEVDILVEKELSKQGSSGWEQGVQAREEAVRIGKAKGSQVDQQNGVTSPKAANEVRRRISRCFSGGKGMK